MDHLNDPPFFVRSARLYESAGTTTRSAQVFRGGDMGDSVNFRMLKTGRTPKCPNGWNDTKQQNLGVYFKEQQKLGFVGLVPDPWQHHATSMF